MRIFFFLSCFSHSATFFSCLFASSRCAFVGSPAASFTAACSDTRHGLVLCLLVSPMMVPSACACAMRSLASMAYAVFLSLWASLPFSSLIFAIIFSPLAMATLAFSLRSIENCLSLTKPCAFFLSLCALSFDLYAFLRVSLTFLDCFRFLISFFLFFLMILVASLSTFTFSTCFCHFASFLSEITFLRAKYSLSILSAFFFNCSVGNVPLGTLATPLGARVFSF